MLRDNIDADTGRALAADLALKGVRAEYVLGPRPTLDILMADESQRVAQSSLASNHSAALNAEAALLRARGTLVSALFDTGGCCQNSAAERSPAIR